MNSELFTQELAAINKADMTAIERFNAQLSAILRENARDCAAAGLPCPACGAQIKPAVLSAGSSRG